MRGVRRPNARNKVFNKRSQPQSSLSSLPYTNSKNTNIKTKYKRTTKNSIQKTPEKSHEYTKHKHKHEQKQIEEYDSTDSLDQLLDHSFMPNKTIKSNTPRNTMPRKTIKSSAGNKRSKAMALMASKRGKSYNQKDAKREYKNICNELKYKTPYLNKSHSNNFTSLRKSRKIITPKNKNKNDISYINALNINDTPKILLKGLETPCTPTPVKLMKHLNVKTPKTVNNNNNNNVKRKLSLRYDESILENDKNKNQIENSALKRNKNYIETKSWNNVPYTPRNNGNKNGKNKQENDNNMSEFDRLILGTQRLQLPLKFLALLKQFNALESTLALKMRKNNFFVHFQTIEKSVTQITKRNFTKYVFGQILNILPEFYHVQWTAYKNKGAGITKKELRLTVTAMDCQYQNLGQNNNDNDDENVPKKKEKSRDIGIKFLKVSKLRERESIFRLKLYEYIRSIHKQYLIDNILIEFDPFIRGNWHRNFDLENVKDINIDKLPLKPAKNINEMEKMITEQKEQMEFILEKEIELVKKQKANNELPKYLRGLSPTYIAKIRAKDKNRKKNCAKINAKTGNVDENKNRLKKLSYLVNLIRGIYVSLKKGSMSCNDLIKIIKKRHKNQFMLDGEIWKQLQILNELKSKFFIIKEGPILKVAKLNKKVDLNEVFDQINEKIKQ